MSRSDGELFAAATASVHSGEQSCEEGLSIGGIAACRTMTGARNGNHLYHYPLFYK
jgi:hypothetical protein